MRLSRILPAVLQLTLGAALAIAGPLSVTLTTDTLSGNPGSVLVFTGTFTNESSDPVFINEFLPILGSSFNVVDLLPTNSWLDNGTPLQPGATSTLVDLFRVEIPFDFKDFGTHDGTLTVANGTTLGGASDLDAASAIFHVTVTEGTETPEPGTLGLLFVGGCLGLIARRRSTSPISR